MMARKMKGNRANLELVYWRLFNLDTEKVMAKILIIKIKSTYTSLWNFILEFRYNGEKYVRNKTNESFGFWKKRKKKKAYIIWRYAGYGRLNQWQPSGLFYFNSLDRFITCT